MENTLTLISHTQQDANSQDQDYPDIYLLHAKFLIFCWPSSFLIFYILQA
jgi:hypothetical protein